MLHETYLSYGMLRNELVDVFLGWGTQLWRMNRQKKELWVTTIISDNYVALSKARYTF
jgi:hypothetical protein